MKKIIIAEKPSVAKEYAKVLGVSGGGQDGYLENSEWIVTWTVGHLVTLSYPEKYSPDLKEWSLDTLPFLPEKFKYEVIQDTTKQFNTVKSLYNREDISAIYYAGDAGREGLYIQMLVRDMAGHNSGAEEKIVWIHSQTEEEILRGIAEAKPLSEYECMSDAGYMRAIADYLMGINFSRVLSIPYAAMLCSGTGQKRHIPISIGRVMTCVLGMIVQREREIRNFRPEEFYRIRGKIDVGGLEVESEWKESESSRYYQSSKLYEEFGFHEEADALDLIASLDTNITILSVERTSVKKNAPLLYNLAELQSDCTKALHIAPTETLNIAQSLYEKKLITYPRTDARVLSSAVAREIKNNLAGLKNSAYKSFVTEIEKNHYSLGSRYIDDSKITDHFAIIPTGKPAAELSKAEEAVYEMIVRRFLAVFYPAAEFEQVKFEAKANQELFVGFSKVLVKNGFYDVSGLPKEITGTKEDSEGLLRLSKGMSYQVSYSTKKGTTAAPKRYTSGSMILAMENAGKLIEDDELREQIKSSGIGTSATRAEIIDKLIRLNYIELNQAKQILTPSNLGEMVYEVVSFVIPDLFSPEITAKWERNLEQIANGTIRKESFEKEFLDYVRTKCEEIKAGSEVNKATVRQRIYPFATRTIQSEYKKFDSWNTKIKCPICGDDVETTSWGFKCKSNVSKTEGCSFVMGGDILGHRLLTNELAALLCKGKTGPFFDFISQKNRPFAAYLLWNDEKKKIEFEMTDMPWDSTEMSCPKCGRKVLKQGNFFKCEGYIDREHGCTFWVGKIAGKTLGEKTVGSLLKDGQTELIHGFKNSAGNKFDAFLYLDEKRDIKFRFPEPDDLKTSYFCPICGGAILATSNGFRCENYKREEDRKNGSGCGFYAGSIKGHMIKERELKSILEGSETELITFKNDDKKEFAARLYWDAKNMRISFKFDDSTPVQIDVNCPVCKSPLMKGKYGYTCSKRISRTEGCQFYIGGIDGILIDETQLRKLTEYGRTDLISGFRPKEKSKKPFSAYLIWDNEAKRVCFEFPGKEESREVSSYHCPICQRKLYQGKSSLYCDCGFILNQKIASVEIPGEQLRKLLVHGSTDVLSGFFSPKTRKLFSAKLIIDRNAKKVAFEFPERKDDGGD